MVLFAFQATISVFVLVMATTMLFLARAPTALWVSLVVGVIGTWSPAPRPPSARAQPAILPRV